MIHTRCTQSLLTDPFFSLTKTKRLTYYLAIILVLKHARSSLYMGLTDLN